MNTERKAMIGGNQELSDYVMKAQGISRKGLNITCFIGAFIFGWLLTMVFDMLGKKNQGWFYVFPIIICLVISNQTGAPLWVLAIIIYVAGWIQANVILSGYQTSARDHIAQLDRLSGDQLTIDAIMEKAVIQSKVLGEGESAVATLAKALQMPGGDAQLLNMAGLTLFANKRYSNAKQFFGRALSSTNDDLLIKIVKQNLVNVEKKPKQVENQEGEPEPTGKTAAQKETPKIQQVLQRPPIQAEHVDVNVPAKNEVLTPDEMKLSRIRKEYGPKGQSVQKIVGIMVCPHCKIKVIPKSDGTCPGCQSKIM